MKVRIASLNNIFSGINLTPLEIAVLDNLNDDDIQNINLDKFRIFIRFIPPIYNSKLIEVFKNKVIENINIIESDNNFTGYNYQNFYDNFCLLYLSVIEKVKEQKAIAKDLKSIGMNDEAEYLDSTSTIHMRSLKKDLIVADDFKKSMENIIAIIESKSREVGFQVEGITGHAVFGSNLKKEIDYEAMINLLIKNYSAISSAKSDGKAIINIIKRIENHCEKSQSTSIDYLFNEKTNQFDIYTRNYGGYDRPDFVKLLSTGLPEVCAYIMNKTNEKILCMK